jgi:hypothetical protein
MMAATMKAAIPMPMARKALASACRSGSGLCFMVRRQPTAVARMMVEVNSYPERNRNRKAANISPNRRRLRRSPSSSASSIPKGIGMSQLPANQHRFGASPLNMGSMATGNRNPKNAGQPNLERRMAAIHTNMLAAKSDASR